MPRPDAAIMEELAAEMQSKVRVSLLAGHRLQGFPRRVRLEVIAR